MGVISGNRDVFAKHAVLVRELYNDPWFAERAFLSRRVGNGCDLVDSVVIHDDLIANESPVPPPPVLVERFASNF